MGKNRRTRKEKMRTRTRYNLSELLTINKHEDAVPRLSAKPLTSYAYVASDIRKTLLIIIFLAGLNIVFYLLLKIKFITIPGLGF